MSGTSKTKLGSEKVCQALVLIRKPKLDKDDTVQYSLTTNRYCKHSKSYQTKQSFVNSNYESVAVFENNQKNHSVYKSYPTPLKIKTSLYKKK